MDGSVVPHHCRRLRGKPRHPELGEGLLGAADQGPKGCGQREPELGHGVHLPALVNQSKHKLAQGVSCVSGREDSTCPLSLPPLGWEEMHKGALLWGCPGLVLTEEEAGPEGGWFSG